MSTTAARAVRRGVHEWRMTDLRIGGIETSGRPLRVVGQGNELRFVARDLRKAAFSPISFCDLDSLFRARGEVPPDVPWSVDGRTTDERDARVRFSVEQGSAPRREDQ